MVTEKHANFQNNEWSSQKNKEMEPILSVQMNTH